MIGDHQCRHHGQGEQHGSDKLQLIRFTLQIPGGITADDPTENGDQESRGHSQAIASHRQERCGQYCPEHRHKAEPRAQVCDCPITPLSDVH